MKNLRCRGITVNGLSSSHTNKLSRSTLQWKNLRRHRADPISSYSDFVMHIDSKSGLDAKIDPPLQTPRIGLHEVIVLIALENMVYFTFQNLPLINFGMRDNALYRDRDRHTPLDELS